MFIRSSNRRTQTPSSGTPPPVSASVSQARLDRIAHWPRPSPCFHASYLKWINRLSDPAEYPTAECLARIYDLGEELSVLRLTLADPPESWTGTEYVKAAERELRLSGQYQALTEILQRRQNRRQGAPTSWPTLRRSI